MAAPRSSSAWRFPRVVGSWLQLVEHGVEASETTPPRTAGTGRATRWLPPAVWPRAGCGRRWASRFLEMRPARSSTLRCFEIAGWVMANGSASSFTVASPDARRARMARRVGSARAAKVASRRVVAVCITNELHNQLVLYTRDPTCQPQWVKSRSSTSDLAASRESGGSPSLYPKIGGQARTANDPCLSTSYEQVQARTAARIDPGRELVRRPDAAHRIRAGGGHLRPGRPGARASCTSRPAPCACRFCRTPERKRWWRCSIPVTSSARAAWPGSRCAWPRRRRWSPAPSSPSRSPRWCASCAPGPTSRSGF